MSGFPNWSPEKVRLVKFKAIGLSRLIARSSPVILISNFETSKWNCRDRYHLISIMLRASFCPTRLLALIKYVCQPCLIRWTGWQQCLVRMGVLSTNVGVICILLTVITCSFGIFQFKRYSYRKKSGNVSHFFNFEWGLQINIKIVNKLPPKCPVLLTREEKHSSD